MKKLIDIINLLKDKDLLADCVNLDSKTIVEDITYDSREVKKGCLFFCKGSAFKKQYLLSSFENGAVAYVSEKDYNLNVPTVIVKDIRKSMAIVAAYFFDYPDKKLKIIGVTGTKGKTTTVKFLKSIFDVYLYKNNKKPCGIISSIDIYDGISDTPAKLTTPEAITLYRHLSNAYNSGLEFVILEVSSQALKYDRVTGVKFNMGAFLNIGEDHISEKEHPNFEDYLYSKLKLACQSVNFIYNLDTDCLDTVKKEIEKSKTKAKTFSFDNDKADIYAKNISHKELMTNFTSVFENHENDFSINEPGNYNVENALCAIYIANFFGVDMAAIQKGLLDARVEGRNNILVSNDKKIVVWVSYAHNAISFEKSFETIEEIYKDYKIISVYGAPGDKAKGRLFDLADIGAKNSDIAIFVPDDPGSKPQSEIAEKMTEVAKAYTCEIESYENREDGIKSAFRHAENNDKTVLFLAGKGIDTYDYVKGEYKEIESDLSIARRYLKNYNENL